MLGLMILMTMCALGALVLTRMRKRSRADAVVHYNYQGRGERKARR